MPKQRSTDSPEGCGNKIHQNVTKCLLLEYFLGVPCLWYVNNTRVCSIWCQSWNIRSIKPTTFCRFDQEYLIFMYIHIICSLIYQFGCVLLCNGYITIASYIPVTHAPILPTLYLDILLFNASKEGSSERFGYMLAAKYIRFYISWTLLLILRVKCVPNSKYTHPTGHKKLLISSEN